YGMFFFECILAISCPVRCCTKYSSQPFPVLRLKDFTWQDATMTCNIEAVIFTSVKNRQICANPDDLWVQNAILLLCNSLKQIFSSTPGQDRNILPPLAEVTIIPLVGVI
uniref:Chemokine interleukin-8-like domain-containing protein n=1 Tax=Sinocyclocheilus rhinocerous TaxID=307959 RepID=A0A673KYI8_9TELE